MKTNVKNIALAMLVLSTTIFGCRKDPIEPLAGNYTNVDENKTVLHKPMDDNPIDKTIKTYLMNGSWIVVAFLDDGQYGSIKTHHLSGYKFKFIDNNVVLVENKEKVIPGKWNIYVEKGMTKVAIDFGFQPLIEINNSWTPLAFTSKLIRLQAKGDDGMIHLDFQQIDDTVKPAEPLK